MFVCKVTLKRVERNRSVSGRVACVMLGLIDSAAHSPRTKANTLRVCVCVAFFH